MVVGLAGHHRSAPFEPGVARDPPTSRPVVRTPIVLPARSIKRRQAQRRQPRATWHFRAPVTIKSTAHKEEHHLQSRTCSRREHHQPAPTPAPTARTADASQTPILIKNPIADPKLRSGSKQQSRPCPRSRALTRIKSTAHNEEHRLQSKHAPDRKHHQPAPKQHRQTERPAQFSTHAITLTKNPDRNPERVGKVNS